MEKEKICQSCAMPLKKASDFGTNADLSKNQDYCTYCYQKGAFTEPTLTLKEAIALNVKMASKAGMSEKEMKEFSEKTLPHLKRWKKRGCCCCCE